MINALLAAKQAQEGLSTDPAISGDGSRVVWESVAANLVPSDTNAREDVFARLIATSQTIRVSVSTAGGQATNTSNDASLSTDGTKVGFHSTAANLVTGDTNSRGDVFVRDLSATTTVRRSLTAGGAQVNEASSGPWLAGDGTAVAFASVGTNLVPTDTDATSDSYVRGPGLDASTYAYDRLYRLTSVSGPDGPRTYAYDPAGNRTSKVLGGSPTAYTYDRADRITTAGHQVADGIDAHHCCADRRDPVGPMSLRLLVSPLMRLLASESNAERVAGETRASADSATTPLMESRTLLATPGPYSLHHGEQLDRTPDADADRRPSLIADRG